MRKIVIAASVANFKLLIFETKGSKIPSSLQFEMQFF